jgi:hypothetical protein
MKEIQDYQAATSITNLSKLFGSDADGSTKNFVMSDVSKFARTKSVKTINASNEVALSDANNIIYCTLASNSVLNLNTNATAAIPVGSEVTVVKTNLFTLSVSPAVGVTLNGGTSAITTTTSQAYIVLTKVGTDVWMLSQLS